MYGEVEKEGRGGGSQLTLSLLSHSYRNPVFTTENFHDVNYIFQFLTYMVTGRYKKPALLTPKLASEVFTLAKQWEVFKMKLLKNSIEKHLCEELKTVRAYACFSELILIYIFRTMKSSCTFATCSSSPKMQSFRMLKTAVLPLWSSTIFKTL